MDSPGLGLATGDQGVARAAPAAVPTASAPAATLVTSPLRWRDRLKLAAYRTAARTLPWLPGWLTYRAALGAGTLLWALLPGMRRQADASLAHIPVLAAAPRSRRVAVRRLFGHLALNYLELFTIRHQSVARVRASFAVEGEEMLDAAIRRGRGVVVLAAHCGDFDRAITIVAGTGVPVWLPVERLEPPAVFALCRALRTHHGVHAVPADSPRALRELFAALRRGEIVLMTADRDVLGTGVAVPFFGAPARLPVGPLVLARRTGAALLGAFSWRLPGQRSAGTFVPVALDAYDGPSTVARDPDGLALGHERRVTARDLLPIARLLESPIAAHPEQWVAAFTPIWGDQSLSPTGKDTSTT